MPQQHPIWVWIDPSRACNLACAFCYSKQSHADEYLSMVDFKRFLDIFLGSDAVIIQKMHLNWRGDPLMNPLLPQLIAELESRAPYFPFELHTNGTLMTEGLAADLVEATQHGELFVSIDGGTERGHDLNRGKGTFRLALRGLRMLLSARGSANRPRLGILQLDLGDDESAYDCEFMELASEVDDWVRVDPVHPHSARRIRVHHSSVNPKQGEQPGGVAEIRPQDRWWTLEPASQKFIPMGPCFWAGNALFVAPTGDVSVCLLSHTAEGVLGNLHRDSLEHVLSAAHGFRTQIAALSRSQISHCSKCFMAEGLPKVTLTDLPHGPLQHQFE